MLVLGCSVKDSRSAGSCLALPSQALISATLILGGHSQPVFRHSGSNRVRLSDNIVFTFCQNQADQFGSYHAVNRYEGEACLGVASYEDEAWLGVARYQDKLFILVSFVSSPSQQEAW